MGKISQWMLVICRERCESSFAFELRLHTGKQHSALSASGAAILSFENSYTNFAGFIYTKNKICFLVKPCYNYHISVTQLLWGKASTMLSFYFFASSISSWRKIFIPHRGTQNLSELISMFLCTLKAEIKTWESNWPHASPYWQTPLRFLFEITSKSDLKSA